MTPGVGVVVATRDRRASLARTLERLTGLPERPEILVVDNGSTDGTAAMVRERFPYIRVLRLPRNRGALARTHGVRHARAPYVAFCDDDSWWAPGSLTRAAALMRDHPRLGLLAGAALIGDDERPDPMNAALAASPLGRAPDLPGTSVLGFLCCAAVVRREAYLQAGGFHPVLFFGGEESLLAYDLAARGWGVVHRPDVVAHHHPEPLHRAGRDVRWRRNELLTCWLRRPLPRVLGHTVQAAAEARHDGAVRRALYEALARLPVVVAHRRRLPATVEADIRLLEKAGGHGPHG
ncbi:glycosyltransferase family 2 protein [Streptomyces sp. NPDC049585]|uniref:glycosyltransferase family 2 protein n=1 Tax=Streptomyces sp. NPDC049585 TaxID=3155154 RepID=UPI00344315AA